MKLTLKSQKLAETFRFYTLDGYVYVDTDSQERRQICTEGFLGGTIEFRGSDAERFERVCRRWLRKLVKNS